MFDLWFLIYTYVLKTQLDTTMDYLYSYYFSLVNYDEVNDFHSMREISTFQN
jgi:hypothetical protein